jgi:hypothetical protein
MCRALIAAAGFSLALSACAHYPVIKPEPSVPRAPGNQNVAIADNAGVRVLVAGDAWKGDPSNLAEIFTPVHLTVENHSGKALRIMYSDFALTGSTGFRYAAIPPLLARGAVAQVSPVPPRFYADRFYIAGHYGYYYPALTPWTYPFPYDPWYFDRYYGYWQEPLPTPDMLAEALPEGAIQDSGRVAGFLYFQDVAKMESRVNFEMNLVDASTGQSFGSVAIPFNVSK